MLQCGAENSAELQQIPGVGACSQVPHSGKSANERNLNNRKVVFAANEDREQNLKPCKGQFCSISFRKGRRRPLVSIPLVVAVLSTMTKQ
jgi:hypothetical protein